VRERENECGRKQKSEGESERKNERANEKAIDKRAR